MCGATNGFNQSINVLLQLITAVTPCIVDRFHQLHECFAWVIGPAIKRFTCRGAKDSHGPAATSSKRLHCIHVDRINIGTFFSVHFDVHKQLVHDRCGGAVFKTLMRHHVAPVAGGVADRQQNGFACSLRFGKSLVTPLIPMDGVISMLPKIWRRSVGESVHEELCTHGVVATVNMDDLASCSGEPVRHQC